MKIEVSTVNKELVLSLINVFSARLGASLGYKPSDLGLEFKANWPDSVSLYLLLLRLNILL